MADGDSNQNGQGAAAPDSKALCNLTKLLPSDDLANNFAWVEEFRNANPNPTAGYSQHVNNLGLTTFACVERLSNDSVQRIVLAGLEVLAARSALKGDKSHDLDESKAPEDAAKRLAASAEFAKRRPQSIQDAKANQVYTRVKANAKRSGIILNIPADTFGDADDAKPAGGKTQKKTAGAA